MFSKEDRERLNDLAKKQKQLEQNTQGVRSELQRLSQKTATLGPSVMSSLSKAASSMNQSERDLGQAKSLPAQKNQEQALAQLQQGKDALSEAQDALSDMMGQGGPAQSGGSGRQVLKRSSTPGSSGSPLGKVRLPRPEDFKPQKAFREELLNALKEKYPKAYEEIIHQYYKKLAD